MRRSILTRLLPLAFLAALALAALALMFVVASLAGVVGAQDPPPNPSVGAVIGTGGQGDSAVGQGWSSDVSVTVKVFDGPDPATATLLETRIGYPGGPENNWWFGVGFDLLLQAGWLVQLSGDDSGLTIATVVTDLTMTGWDPLLGTVNGTTSDPSPVAVDLWYPEPAWRNADMSWDAEAGLWRWSADFSRPAIEEQGEWGGPVELDSGTTGGQGIQNPDPWGGTLVHFGYQGDTWGDVDCYGSVDIGDAQKIARSLINLDVSQEPGCPAIGTSVEVDGVTRLWGDADCDRDVDIGDAQKKARFLINLDVSQEPGCPQIGATVQIPAT